MMTVQLNGLLFFAKHGLFEEEKILGNHFIVDVKISYRPPAAITDISQTINYVEVYRLVEKRMQQPTALLETLASAITLEILQQYPLAEEVYFAITKTKPPFKGIQGSVGVNYTRNRKSL